MSKVNIYSNSTKNTERLVEGVRKIADLVGKTLGPRGRTITIHIKGKPVIITKDGVSVASYVHFDDPVENTAAQIIKQAAKQTETDSGDGTTTSTVLAWAILQKAQRYLLAGVDPQTIKYGIDAAVEEISEEIRKQSTRLKTKKDVESVATISANGEKVIGTMLANIIDKIGKDGSLVIEEARSIKTTAEVIEGFRFDSGFLSSEFVTNEHKGLVQYDSPLLFVTDRKIESVEQVMPVLSLIARAERPAVIIADTIEAQPLSAFIMNAARGTLKIAAVKAPKYGEERRSILKDLAISTGATLISAETNLNFADVEMAHFGECKSVEISRSFTTVIGGRGSAEAVEKRLAQLKREIKEATDMAVAERIQERATRLGSAIGVIYVGGATEIEAIERKHRIEDALEAVKSAQEEGIVQGGGLALYRAAREIEIPEDDNKYGYMIIKEAAKEPIKRILLNAGESVDLVLQDISASDDIGYDVRQKKYVKMVEEGIIDPAKVVRCALRNAASVATTILSTTGLIIEKE